MRLDWVELVVVGFGTLMGVQNAIRFVPVAALSNSDIPLNIVRIITQLSVFNAVNAECQSEISIVQVDGIVATVLVVNLDICHLWVEPAEEYY